jgi:hypothetical protein
MSRPQSPTDATRTKRRSWGPPVKATGSLVELSDKLAAVELTKFMVGLRADRMTDQDIFALYRECLRVIGESETAAPAETDPQKIATALMAILNAEKPKKRPANRQPKLKIRRHKRGT